MFPIEVQTIDTGDNGVALGSVTKTITVPSLPDLVMYVTAVAADSVTAMTFGGTALTKIVEDTDGDGKASIWRLTDPTPSTATLSISMSSISSTFGVFLCPNVDTSSTPEDTYGNTSGAGAAAALSITTTKPNDLIIAAVSSGLGATVSPDTGMNQVTPISGACTGNAGYQYAVTPGTQAIAWTLGGSANISSVALAVKHLKEIDQRDSELTGTTEPSISSVTQDDAVISLVWTYDATP